MITKDISYSAGRKVLTGYLAAPDGAGNRPGVLVCHQGGGLRDHEKTRARKLADLGYVAFALDVYGEVAGSQERAMELLTGIMRDEKL